MSGSDCIGDPGQHRGLQSSKKLSVSAEAYRNRQQTFQFQKKEGATAFVTGKKAKAPVKPMSGRHSRRNDSLLATSNIQTPCRRWAATQASTRSARQRQRRSHVRPPPRRRTVYEHRLVCRRQNMLVLSRPGHEHRLPYRILLRRSRFLDRQTDQDKGARPRQRLHDDSDLQYCR